MKPAARMGDNCAHGGTVVVGMPTVLVGKIPQSCMGDMHVCPMVEGGVVPHVGGPIVLGSFTVLTGSRPTARMGDTAVCAGPPDTIVKGEFTVLVGG